MDLHLLDTLRKKSLLEILPSGKEGIRVSLQYQPRFISGSRMERHQLLMLRFAEIARLIAGFDGSVDLSSISVSGQTVEAVIPVDHFDEIKDSLDRQQIRVDVILDRQVV